MNFVGAKHVIKELYEFLRESQTIADFCSSQGIQWDFIPEHAPHFGRLWESAVKSLKTHLHGIVGNSRLNFEELTTVLSQIEAYLNSRPLGVIPHCNHKGVEVLTPGHLLISCPIAIFDHDLSYFYTTPLAPVRSASTFLEEMAVRVSHKSPKDLQVAQTHLEFGSWGRSHSERR